jgi:DNA-binding CsgD family transcriptional regulator
VADTHGLTLFRIRALHELGTVDLLGGTRVDRLDEARQAALEAGALSTGVTVSLQITAWHLNHFELHQAIDTARTCASEAHRLRMPVTEALGLLMEAGAHALQGEKAEMERAIEQAMAVAGDNPEVRGVAALQMRAAYWFVREERPKAAAELDAGMELLRHTPATAPLRGMWALVHALDAADGDKAVAEVESSGLTVYWLIRGWVGHARAVLLGRRGRLRDAEVAFAEADQTFAGCRWFQLHARRLVAEAALADGWGDPRAWLTEALVFFDQEGYGAVASACRALLRGAGAPVPRQRRPANDAPGPIAHLGFTARELEVLIHLADAQPTREIARRLFLSPKTVERHIANIANKVGVNSRAELIAFAARHMGPGANS